MMARQANKVSDKTWWETNFTLIEEKMTNKNAYCAAVSSHLPTAHTHTKQIVLDDDVLMMKIGIL